MMLPPQKVPAGDTDLVEATKLITKRLRPEMIERTEWIIDTSGIVDMLVPPREPGQRGRIGNIRANTRLFLIGLALCARLGHETTVMGIHQVLTEAVDRETQWKLGVLRQRGTKSTKRHPKGAVATLLVPAIVANGKPRKRILPSGVEEIGYDDLYNATEKLRERWNYGTGSAPNLDPQERQRRERGIAKVVDVLIACTTVPRVGSTYAIDATGQWAWIRGHAKEKKVLEKAAEGKTSQQITDLMTADPDELTTEEIAMDDDGTTAPMDQSQTVPKAAQNLSDAAWGYKTGKDGRKEVGFGFHQHTIVRVADANAPDDSEPLLIEAFALTPANADVVGVSLDLVDRIRARHSMKVLLGDMLYSNLRASRWAVPLAQRGVEQGLQIRVDQHKVVDIQGAQMQHGWLHCPAAPMDQRPLPEENASPSRWEEIEEAADGFRHHWAFDRKESGLGANLTSKWVCPAVAGRVGCPARGHQSVQAALALGLPVIQPPSDWKDRPCCVNKTTDFTPNPDDPDHQRKIMQREYVATRRWRRLTNRRTFVEGVFGILKNPSRLRLRRGHNRLPGIAMATIVNAVKIAVFNEEQLRMWHAATGKGPADHPLLQPDAPDWGYRNLTQEEAEVIDARHLLHLVAGAGSPDATLERAIVEVKQAS